MNALAQPPGSSLESRRADVAGRLRECLPAGAVLVSAEDLRP